VLGLGNLLAGDDSFGPLVIKRLRDSPPEDADIADAHTDLLAWIEEFPHYELVILLDAVLAPEATPGEIVVLTEEELAGYPDSSPSAHQVSPLLAVRLFRQLHPEAGTRIALVGLRTRAIVLGAAVDESAVERARAQVLSVMKGDAPTQAL